MVTKNEALDAVTVSAKSRRTPKTRIHYDEIVRQRSPILSLLHAAGRTADVDDVITEWVWETMGRAPRDAAEVNSLSLIAYTLVDFEHWGQQTFLVGPHLQAMFTRSALADFRFQDLQLPYPTFFVALPPQSAQPQQLPAGVYVCGVHAKSSGALYGLTILFWPSMNSGRVFGLGLNGDAAGNTPLDELIAAEVKAQIRDPGDLDIAAAVQILCALLLYLQSERPEVEETAESAQQRANASKPLLSFSKAGLGKTKKAKRAPTRAVTPLRRRVLWVAPTLEECQEAAEGAAGPRRRHWVRGHFKRVRPDGPASKWIMPYERCKNSLIQALPRTYTIPEEG